MEDNWFLMATMRLWVRKRSVGFLFHDCRLHRVGVVVEAQVKTGYIALVYYGGYDVCILTEKVFYTPLMCTR